MSLPMKGVGPLHSPLANGSFLGTSDSTGPVALTGNVGATTLLAPLENPRGQYRIDIDVIATTLATSAAAFAINVIYTDDLGTTTRAVLSMDLGTTNRGGASLVFRSNGGESGPGISIFGQPIQFSVTGITTPGPLAATFCITLTRVGLG